MVIEFEIVNPKLISTNDMYMHPVKKCKNGRYTSYTCKAPYLKELQEFYQEKLGELIRDEDIEILKSEVSKDVGVKLEIELGIPKLSIYANDASNFIKSLEDCVVNRIGIDDKYNLEVSISKRVYEPEDSENEEWILKIRISSVECKSYELLTD